MGVLAQGIVCVPKVLFTADELSLTVLQHTKGVISRVVRVAGVATDGVSSTSAPSYVAEAYISQGIL